MLPARERSLALRRSAAVTRPAASRPLRAVVLALAAVACFAALDTSTKYVGQTVPLVMALWCRYAFQAVVMAAMLLPGRGRALLRTRHPGLQLLRGVLLLACSAFAFASFRFMPVGDVTAIGLLTPLAVTLVAVAAFGETVAPLRWACVAGGFAGALAIVRPGGAMLGGVLLLPLGLLAANTGFQIVTSRLSAIAACGVTAPAVARPVRPGRASHARRATFPRRR